MLPWFKKNAWGLIAVAAVAVGTGWAVRRFHQPGRLDVITAQAMDMSQMRPPTGAAPVQLAAVRRGSLADSITYTGSVQAFNTQDISPRITGQVIALPVYPGDTVRAGQVVARLDTAEVGAKADQAAADARSAALAQQVAALTHRLHHPAALEQAAAQADAAQQDVADATAEAQAAADAVTDARAAARSAQANADYWRTEIGREKQLADAGAASRQEYQSEQAQAQAADAALVSAQAKVRQEQAMEAASRAKIGAAEKSAEAAQAMQRMAEADLAVSARQIDQAQEGTAAAQAAAREAAAVQDYARIASPANGVVVERPVAPGTLVQPGTVLVKIAEIDRVRVQARVAVTDLAGIAPGTPVTITPQAAGMKPFPARVTSVFPAADPMSRTAVVEAVVPNPHHTLLPGAFVSVRLARRTVADKLLVPADALLYEGGKPYLWAVSGAAVAAVTTEYECVICHMHYAAADAAKHHYRDPMDGGKLVPVAPKAAPEPAAGLTARRVAVTVGASDGETTEVSAAGLAEGDRVVTRGQAGLTDGAAIVATPWGPDGPEKLPTATAAMQGVPRYRCEKCGMTYSAEDAKKNGYIDPMDGGKLLPVTGGGE